MLTLRFRVVSLSLVSLLAMASHAQAQSFTVDARTIGMGGEAAGSNIALSIVPAGPYIVIPLPIGLIPLVSNFHGFDPTSDKFDPGWAIESSANPLHLTFGRKSPDSDHPESRFMHDLVNGQLSRDLATYSSIHLPDTISAEGLASPAFGGTIKFAKRPSGAFQGVFIGAGPYFSFGTDAAFDPRLTDILQNASHYANSSMLVTDGSRVQLAASFVVGYRTRLEMPGWLGRRDGVYLAVNYRYLHGFKYLQPDTTIRFDTDNQGLVTVNPTTTPIVIDDLEADSGKGRAIDIGVQVVRNGWEGGFGVNGIGNRIDWTDMTLKRFTQTSLLNGGDFIEQVVSNPTGTLRVELPIVTSGNVGYDGDGYGLKASIVHGFNGNSFHGGAEKWLGAVAVRGGARYSRDHWDPTWGVGFGRRVGLDIGFFGTHWNIEDKRQISMAASIRIARQR